MAAAELHSWTRGLLNLHPGVPHALGDHTAQSPSLELTGITAIDLAPAQGYRRPPQLWSSFLRTWSGVQDVVLPYGDEQMHGALRGRAVLVAGLGTGGGGGGRRGGVGGEAVRSAVLQLLRAWPTHEATTGQGGQGEDVVVEELAAAAEVLLVEPQFGAYSGGYCVVVSLPYLHPASFGGEAASAGRQEGEQQGAGRVGGAVDRGLDQLAGYLRRCEACGRHLGAAAGEAGSAAAPAGGAGGGAAAGGAVGGSPGGGGHGGQGRPPPPQQQQLFGWELMRGAAIYEGRRLLQVTIQVRLWSPSVSPHRLHVVECPPTHGVRAHVLASRWQGMYCITPPRGMQ